MEFNWTKGKSTRYLVDVHRWGVSDKFYFHYLREAKALFKKLLADEHPTDTTIIIYDVVNDVHKEFIRL